jgi:hypothetical protein
VDSLLHLNRLSPNNLLSSSGRIAVSCIKKAARLRGCRAHKYPARITNWPLSRASIVHTMASSGGGEALRDTKCGGTHRGKPGGSFCFSGMAAILFADFYSLSVSPFSPVLIPNTNMDVDFQKLRASRQVILFPLSKRLGSMLVERDASATESERSEESSRQASPKVSFVYSFLTTIPQRQHLSRLSLPALPGVMARAEQRL